MKLSDINWSCPYLHSGACKLLKIMAVDLDVDIANRIDLSLKQLGHPVSPDSSTARSMMPAIPLVTRGGTSIHNAFLVGVCWNKPFLL